MSANLRHAFNSGLVNGIAIGATGVSGWCLILLADEWWVGLPVLAACVCFMLAAGVARSQWTWHEVRVELMEEDDAEAWACSPDGRLLRVRPCLGSP